jgi:hypothetical protein
MTRPTRRDATYQRNRKTLLANAPICHWCQRRPATTADHYPVELDRAEDAGLGDAVHSLENLVPSCASCNSSRGARYGNVKRSAITKARRAAVESDERRRPTPPNGFESKPPDPEPPKVPLSSRRGKKEADTAERSRVELEAGENPPRLLTPSWGARTYGPLVAAWAERHLGVTLYPWQILVLDRLLEHDDDGDLRHRWGLTSTARQNGKTVILSALIGWWITEGRLIRGGPQSVLSVAHELRAAEEIHYVLAPILETAFDAEKTYSSFGRKEVRLSDGSIWRIASATPAAGHGQSNDLLIVDELWDVDGEVLHAGLLPTQRARQSPLAAFFSTAGTEKSHAFLRYREQGLDVIDRGEPARLMMAEWSPPPNVDLSDRRYWIQANPAIGHGNLTLQDLEDEASGPDRANFLRASLNLWISSDQAWLEPGEWDELETAADPPPWTVLSVEQSVDGERFVGLFAGPTETGEVHVGTAFVEAREADAWARIRELLPTGATLAITPGLEIHAPPELSERTTRVGHGEILKWTAIVRGMIRDGQIRHGGEMILSEHVGRAVGYRQKGGAMGLSSEKSPGPIEFARCLVWATALASRAKFSTRPAIGGARRR